MGNSCEIPQLEVLEGLAMLEAKDSPPNNFLLLIWGFVHWDCINMAQVGV